MKPSATASPLPPRQHPQLISLLKHNPSPPTGILPFPRWEKKKNPHLFQHFTSVTQIHRSTLTAPPPPHGSPIPPSRHYLARNITPRQPPTLRFPNAGNPILPPPARGYPRPTPQLPPNPRPPLGGARRWAGWTRVGWGGARPSPTSPSPRRRHEGEGVPKPHLQLRPSPGARCPALARAGRKKQGTKRQKSLGQRQAGSSRSRLISDLPPPRPSHPLQGCCCC